MHQPVDLSEDQHNNRVILRIIENTDGLKEWETAKGKDYTITSRAVTTTAT